MGARLSPSWTTAELNGDGLVDVTRVDVTSTISALEVSTLGSAIPRDLLAGVSLLGGKRSVRYGSSSDHLVIDTARKCSLPAGFITPVVAETSSDDGRASSPSAKTYSYDCARWSQSRRVFLGWTEVAIGSDGVANRPQGTFVTRLGHTDECSTQLQGTFWKDANGRFIASRQIYAYNPPGAAPHNCSMLYRQHIEYGGGSGQAMNVLTYFSYDQYGNVTQVLEHGVPSRPGDERTTSISYKAATGPFIVGSPWQVTISEGLPPAMSLLKSTFFCYDGDNGTGYSNCSGLPTQGLLTATQQVDDLGLYVTSEFLYDGFGNVAGIRDANNNGQAIFYDPIHHIYPIASCNALSRCIQQQWDVVTGQRTMVTDENGHETFFGYDNFGRLTSSFGPDGGWARREYLDWGDPNRQRVRYKQDDDSIDGLWTETYFDGLGRSYKELRKGPRPGSRSSATSATQSDSSQIHIQSDWYEIGAPQPLQEVLRYDAAGRPVSKTHPDGTSLRWSYETTAGRAGVASFGERDRRKTAFLDALGRLAEVGETSQGAELITNFAYNAADELVRISDAQGNVTTQEWNRLSHRTRVSDPDMGTWTYKYDLGAISCRAPTAITSP